MKTTGKRARGTGSLVGLLLAVTWLAAAPPAEGALFAAQDKVLVKTQLASGVVKLGGRTALQVSVENARSTPTIDLPRVEGLAIGPLSAPSQHSSTIIRNGYRTSTRSWIWTLPIVPAEKGDFTIPSFTVVADGRTYTTRPLAITVVDDLRGAELLFLELEPSATELVEGQPFTVVLRFGWDLGLNNQIAGINLSLPWWNDLPGVIEVASPERDLHSRRYDVDVNRSEKGSMTEAGVRQLRGREFRTFEIRRSFVPTRPGRIELPRSYFEFTQLIERGGWNRRDRTETYYIGQPSFAIEVSPLPEDGRPYDFTGAVGRFETRSEVDRRDVDAGDSIKLTVEWTGEGNFEFFSVPDLSRLDAFEGFRAYGFTETKEPDRRVAVYDLAPISSDVHEVPGVPLSVWDTEEGAFSTIESQSIPIRVRALVGGGGLAPEEGTARAVRDIRDIETRVEPRAGRGRVGVGPLAGLLLAVPLGWIGLRRAVRRRGDPDAPAERRRRGARRSLARELRGAASAGEQLRALEAFLGARTREPDSAWTGRDVARWLDGRGLELTSASELEELLERLQREAYAQDDAPLERDAILRVAQRLAREGL